MTLGVPKERQEHERRVAISPQAIKKYKQLGLDVVIERGAGLAANIPDETLTAEGATLVDDEKAVFDAADILVKVAKPTEAEVGLLRQGQWLMAKLDALTEQELMAKLSSQGVTAFALELMPRISRAQSMDILSSQSNLAGYKAVLDAQEYMLRAMPLMMTAAGTVPPANVLILGAGVAGLQAIATAKRLGAKVFAFDVRAAVKEQVQSLGATFVEVEAPAEAGEGGGGYAKEMDEDYRRRQSEKIHETLKTMDIVVSTALIPGKPAPRLVTDAMIQDMRPGSVLVDLAVEAGGNIEGSKFGEVVSHLGVTILGYANVPSRVAHDASMLYARNVVNFIEALWDKETGKPKLDREDEIVSGTLVTHDGAVVHDRLQGGNA